MQQQLIVWSIILCPFVIVWIVNLLLSFNKYSRISKTILKEDWLLKKAVGRSKTWLISTTFWMLAEYLFVIVPFIANVIVIYLSIYQKNNIELLTIYSSISLSFIVFGYAINPRRHKKCYRKAYNCIDREINNYLILFENSSSQSRKLAKAMDDGERYIDSSYDIE